jgi:hypothetical protein
MTLMFALFHFAFWEMFNWSEELKKISVENRGVLQILNIESIYMLVFFSAVTFYIGIKKRMDFLANSLLLFVAGYYLMRISTGYFYFGISMIEIIIWILCFVLAALFVTAVFKKESANLQTTGTKE